MGLATIAAIAQAGYGIYQSIKGAKDRKKLKGKRPKYEIPQELLQNMSIAQRMAAEGLPEAQKQEYLQNVDRSAQLSLRGLSSRRAGVGAIAGVQQGMNLASQRLMSLDAQQRLQNQKLAMGARERVAGARDVAFNINKLQPYQQAYGEAKELQGAGIQNIFGGFDKLGAQEQSNKFMSMLGGGGFGGGGAGGGGFGGGGGGAGGGGIGVPGGGFMDTPVPQNQFDPTNPYYTG